MGIDVVHFDGCTSLYQPIGMRINKPIKRQLCEKWEDLLMEGMGPVTGMAKEPSCKMKMDAEWLIDVYNKISEKMGRNAWKKTGFEWF
jgi:hypothetical protein